MKTEIVYEEELSHLRSKTAVQVAKDHDQLAVYNAGAGGVEYTMLDGTRPTQFTGKLAESVSEQVPDKIFVPGNTDMTDLQIADLLIATQAAKNK